MAMQPGAAGEVKEGIPNQPLVPGIPAEPEPGDPTSPSTGVPGEPVPGAPDGDAKKDEGPLAVIRGQIRMDDYRIGALRLDIFDGDHRSHVGQRPSLIRSIEILEPGSFEVKVPLSVGKVWLEASNDENQDGRPGPRDPVGRYRSNPLQLSASGNGGILIDLERNEPPPGGSGAEL